MNSGSSETFTDRFNRLTGGMSDGQLMDILELTLTPLNKIRSGDTKSLKLRGGLRLAKHLRITPWELAGEPAPLQAVPNLTDSSSEFELKFRGGTLHLRAWLVPSGEALEPDRIEHLQNNIRVALFNVFQGSDIVVRDIPVLKTEEGEAVSQHDGSPGSTSYRPECGTIGATGIRRAGSGNRSRFYHVCRKTPGFSRGVTHFCS
jgi:hypothetical protein